jgi:hypothetical protein
MREEFSSLLNVGGLPWVRTFIYKRRDDNYWTFSGINWCVWKEIFLMAQRPVVGHGLLNAEASRSHPGTSHSVRPLWGSDQPGAEASTWQHSQETGIHVPGGIRIHNPTTQAAADPRLRHRGLWDRSRVATNGGRNMCITMRGLVGQIYRVEVRLVQSLLYSSAITLPETFKTVMCCWHSNFYSKFYSLKCTWMFAIFVWF